MRSVSVHSSAAPFFPNIRVLVLALWLMLGCLLPGVSAESAQAETPILKTAGDFWNLSTEERALEHRIELNFTVLFYDQDWQVLWGKQGDLSFFLKTGGAAMPIKQGDIVSLSGTISEDTGLKVAPNDVAIHGQAQLPEPSDATLLIDKAWKLEHKFVRLTGMVDFTTIPDAKHTKIGMIVHGTPVTAILLSSSPPPKIGAAIQISGFLSLEGTPTGNQNINLWALGDDSMVLKYWVQAQDRFRLPITATSKIETAPRDKPVHVRGRVKLHESGLGLWMTDDAGEVFIESPQRNHLEAGTQIEAVGSPSMRGNRPLITDARYFTLPELSNPSENQPELERPSIRSGSDIYALDAKDKQVDLPVDLVLRVLFYDPYWKTLWAEDNKTRFYVNPGEKNLHLGAGQLVHIRGVYSDPLGLRAKASDIKVLEEKSQTPPPDATNEISPQSTLNGRVVLLTGYIESQTRIDEAHVALRMLVNERQVNLIALAQDNQAFPEFQGAIVTAQGLLSYTPPKAIQEESFALMVAAPEDIQQLHWLRSDARLALPITRLASFPELLGPGYVHIAGHVAAFQRGKYIDLRDEAGQVRVISLQNESLQIGEYIEAFGIPEINGLNYVLRNALFIRSSNEVQKNQPNLSSQALRLNAQISSLSNSEASRKFPVALRVHVSWSDASRRDFYAEDGSGGLQFILPATGMSPPLPGDIIDVIGESDGEGSYPRVRVSVLLKIRSQEPPSPIQVSLEQLRTGVAQNCAVELRGVLSQVSNEGRFTRLHFVSNAGPFQGLLATGPIPPDLRGAILNVQGVCTLGASGLRSPDVTLLLQSSNNLSITEKAPQQLPSIPAQSIASLALNPPKPRTEKWMRLFGTLTYQKAGSHLYLQDGSETLRVFSSQTTRFQPGDYLDVIGLPSWLGDQLVLREAFLRKSRSSQEPTPRIPPTPYLPEFALENVLVSMEGTLVACLEVEGKAILTLQNKGHFFSGELLRKPGEELLNLQSGLNLRLTGIYHANTREESLTTNLSLELRDPDDILIIKRPAWLSPERAIGIVATLSLISLLAAIWIIQLRRLVGRQTLTIRRQMEKESQLTADLERATRLESLGMLAGGIAHDFNNMLTIIVGNLSLARMDAPAGSPMHNFLQEAERGAMRARNLTQQLLTFARGGNPVRKAENLAHIVEEETSDATSNGQLKPDYHLAADARLAFIDRAQIAQVLQNILSNSIQAGATRIAISLRNDEIPEANVYGLKPGTYLRLSLLDDGPGIPPKNIAKVFDPYFTTRKSQRGLGLSLVRSIVLKHEGYVCVSSEPGSGAELLLWLPAAPESYDIASSIPATDQLPKSPSATTTGSTEGATILLMDDEAPVRLMINALMRRLGYQVTLTADGAAAVREYKKAMEAGRRFDLVILDLSVPNGMGGMEAMEQMRVLDPKVLAIVSSGYSNDPIMADHQSFGFAAMVPKPYAIDELTKTVEVLLRK